MITKLWNAFKAWHNKAPAPIEFVVSAKVKQIKLNEDLHKVQADNKPVAQPKKPKPHIYWKYYPTSKRGFWLVSHIPKGSWHNDETASLWKAAHQKVRELNRTIQKRAK